MAKQQSRIERAKAGVRAAWADVKGDIARASAPIDPPADQERDGVRAGQWPGYPTDRLPPECPVVPLGISGKVSYFVDTSGQLLPIAASEWGKKILLQLFAGRHQYLHWAWPRFNAKTFQINGLEVDEAMSCLISGAQARGIFSPQDRIRGRGAWSTRGGLIWHGGDRIYRIDGVRLQASPPGEVDGVFYPNLARTTSPWPEPVSDEENPAHDILAAIQGWNWERGILDPLLVLGWIGCAFLGGALDWRPHLYTTGDKGVGKSTLHFLIKSILGNSLHSSADTTPAGIYQRVQQDSLPVAIDELEATDDNRRALGVVSLARLASSGAVMYRGGGEHQGVEFQLRNTFFMSGINPPPMSSADRSRLAILNLGRLDPAKVTKPPTLDVDVTGRMILRRLMDGWTRLPQLMAEWRDELRAGGIDSRGQDTWGTLLAVAHLMVGREALEEAGLPMFEGATGRVGRSVAVMTAQERADQEENWVDCLDYLLGCSIDAWKDGEKPSIGGAIERWERPEGWSTDEVNRRLALVGLRVLDRLPGTDYPGHFLAIPTGAAKAPLLAKLYERQKWGGGVWSTALKQAPDNIVLRNLGNSQVCKINRVPMRCLIIDLAAYDKWKDEAQ